MNELQQRPAEPFQRPAPAAKPSVNVSELTNDDIERRLRETADDLWLTEHLGWLDEIRAEGCDGEEPRVFDACPTCGNDQAHIYAVLHGDGRVRGYYAVCGGAMSGGHTCGYAMASGHDPFEAPTELYEAWHLWQRQGG